MTGLKPHAVAFAGVLCAALYLAAVLPAWSQTSNQASYQLEGVPNWGRVTDMLYRGGQPDLTGFLSLQHQGVGIVVDFRDETNEMANERRQVESLGIKYVSIPWNGHDQPSNSQVVQFLDLVRANPQAKIFVHCKAGADRTGVMVAAYRIALEHRTASEAVSEMHQYHYHHFTLPQLERYVNSLPQLLHGNPLFSAYAVTPALPSGPKTMSPAAAAAAEVGAAVVTPAMAK